MQKNQIIGVPVMAMHAPKHSRSRLQMVPLNKPILDPCLTEDFRKRSARIFVRMEFSGKDPWNLHICC